MNMNGVLSDKIDRVIELMLFDGIKPSDIADNVFLPHYESVSYRKDGDCVVGEVTFCENNGEGERCTLRYTYSSKERIERIEEEVKGSIWLLWDREEIITQLLGDIISTLKNHYTGEEMEKFVSTLPPELCARIYSMLGQAA